MKAVVAAFNQEKALVGAFSVITNLRMELFQALGSTGQRQGSRAAVRINQTSDGVQPGPGQLRHTQCYPDNYTFPAVEPFSGAHTLTLIQCKC